MSRSIESEDVYLDELTEQLKAYDLAFREYVAAKRGKDRARLRRADLALTQAVEALSDEVRVLWEDVAKELGGTWLSKAVRDYLNGKGVVVAER